MKSGYHHIGIHKDDQKFLGFSWPDEKGVMKHYVFAALPFGLSSAPFIFTKVFRPILSFLRKRGIACALYLDDGLIWASTFSACEEAIALVKVTLKRAGVVIQEEKSVLIPVKKLTWLGMEIDLERSVMAPTDKRIEKIKDALKNVKKKYPTVKERLKLTGLIASLWVVLGPKASVFTKAIHRSVIAFRSLDERIPLIEEELKEILLIENLMNRPCLRSLLPPKTVFTFHTDASAFALGVVSQNKESFSRPLTDFERVQSSTYRELAGVLFGLQCFKDQIIGSEVHVYTDNQNVVPILRKGSMKSLLNQLTIEICGFLEYINSTLISHWIPREENTLADKASRIPDKDDWSILPHIFERVIDKLGLAHVDRFASCVNAKLPRFNSVVPSPGSEAVDAFTEEWKGVVNYCVPPIDLLYPTVTFILKGQYPAILGFPDWPTLPIYPLLKTEKGRWKDFISSEFRINKGAWFLSPASHGPSMFDSPFLKSDFVFLRLF
uniref:Reverse transcriptase domain-containing protein n=1 Tax=Panagrolaimus superbus TaxID=310955 RepID=A0A914YPR8_9BILA